MSNVVEADALELGELGSDVSPEVADPVGPDGDDPVAIPRPHPGVVLSLVRLASLVRSQRCERALIEADDLRAGRLGLLWEAVAWG